MGGVPLSMPRCTTPYAIPNKDRYTGTIRDSKPYLRSRFSIPICTAHAGWYVPVRQVIGRRTARYRAVPPKSTVDGRLKEKSIVGG
ncbi:hypothetical protein B296_00051925 [Ensete ventricosum]|uniref:Uncharacterized protein n=1 Tax=Ensete ventricosum TaxID=4639 RepID=A0A426X6W5_ENSVE|nr:hypothetical protein B296_00051925 [Ensete ventricosum]